MADRIVALNWLEYDDAGTTRRVAPGDPIPDGFPKGDIATLRDNGEIGTLTEFRERVDEQDREAREASLRAQAAAEGFRLVRSSDGGSAADARG
jgi:hypothetical protein